MTLKYIFFFFFFFFLEKAVIELLFEFGVSPFQFEFFIEHLDKIKNVAVWEIKCMGVQGKKSKNNPLPYFISRRKKESFQLGYSQKEILYNLWLNDGIKIRYAF